MQFTKLFNSILDSTIWQEPPPTKLVWITMLAMSDRSGEVHASIPGLAKRAGVTISECESALECLLSPDNYSRTKDHEGRRITEIDGGFALLNHGKYRALLSAEERREYNRRKQAEYRAHRKMAVNDMSMTVNHNKQCQHSTEAEAEVEAETDPKRTARAPTLTRENGAARAPIPFPDEPESNQTTTSQNHMQDLAAKVRNLRPAWKLPLTYAEMQDLMGCAAALDALTDADWQMIRDYLHARLPQGDPGWQPRSRGKLIQSLPDVYSHAVRWSGKNQPTTPDRQGKGGFWK